MKNVVITTLNSLTTEEHKQLSELLVEVVNDGASIGFIAPLSFEKAFHYWSTVLAEDTLLLVAKLNDRICGTVQLLLSTKENGLHRAEVAKLLVLPSFRRLGIARQLLIEIEKKSKQSNRHLLFLDTREHDVSNLLYQSMGYCEAGKIPQFAKSSTGQFDATVLYYKLLD